MSKFAALLTVIGLSAVAPLALADTAQLELQPGAFEVERTLYIRDDIPSAAVPAAPTGADEFFYRHTGGVSPQ